MLAIIVAYDRNRGIGKANQMPWHLSDDLKHFKRTTYHQTVVMGRKTYESMGGALPKRHNIVLTRQRNGHFPGCTIIHSLDAISHISQKNQAVFIIGGEALFKAALPLADRLYITRIDANTDADTFFPEWPVSQFELVSSRYFNQSASNDFDFEIQTWDRI
jgi:dihydrofolate reductase